MKSRLLSKYTLQLISIPIYLEDSNPPHPPLRSTKNCNPKILPFNMLLALKTTNTGSPLPFSAVTGILAANTVIISVFYMLLAWKSGNSDPTPLVFWR